MYSKFIENSINFRWKSLEINSFPLEIYVFSLGVFREINNFTIQPYRKNYEFTMARFRKHDGEEINLR